MSSPPEMVPNTSLNDALRLQQAAFKGDMDPSLAARLDRLERLERLLERDGKHFATQISQDFGGRSATEISIAETLTVVGGLRYARRYLKRWMKPRRPFAGLKYLPGHCLLRPQPLGVVGIISPWNYPLLLALSPLTGVLAAGNRALLKPSELTPAFSAALQASIADFFAPEEVAVITGDADTGRQFAELPLDHLLFTGSTAVGRLVAQAAAKNLTPVTLELGGKSPLIIDDSCELLGCADQLAWGKLLNAGQTCIAPDYALVPHARIDAFVTAMQGAVSALYPKAAINPDYTSIISDRHHQRLLDLIEDARRQGAQVIELAPGAVPAAGSRKLAPVILTQVKASMRVMQEEIFGPVLPVIGYDTLDEAIRHVNDRDRPLALYWFGTDTRHRDQVIAQTLSGGVTINDTLLHLVQENLPFGGVGPSGQGSYHGEHGFRQFSKEKPVFIQSRLSFIRLLYPPYHPKIDRLLRVLSRL